MKNGQFHNTLTVRNLPRMFMGSTSTNLWLRLCDEFPVDRLYAIGTNKRTAAAPSRLQHQIKSRLIQVCRSTASPTKSYTSHAIRPETAKWEIVWIATTNPASTGSRVAEMSPLGDKGTQKELLAPSKTGMIMSPAPCALAMMHDQHVRSQKPTCIPTQVGCRARQSFQTATPIRIAEPPICNRFIGMASPRK